MGFCAEMVVTNTFFVFEKILNQCFFPKNFFISFFGKEELYGAHFCSSCDGVRFLSGLHFYLSYAHTFCPG